MCGHVKLFAPIPWKNWLPEYGDKNPYNLPK